MDNLTHSLIGATVANAGLKQKLGRGTTLALIIGSNITDIDIFGAFFSDLPSFAYRRMWTHSIVGIPLLSAVFGVLFGWIYKNLGFKKAFGLFLLGTSLHVLFDLMNSYGVVVLHPFSLRRFELAWVFIIDLAIWAMLLLPLLLAVVPKFRPRLTRWSKAAVVVLSVYVGICGALRWRASSLLRSMANTFVGEDSRVLFTYVFPEALGPHRFRGVVRFSNAYHVFLIHALPGRIAAMPKEGQGLVLTEEGSPEVQQILQTKQAQDLMWFFKAPVWKREDQTNIWKIYDLRFQSAVLDRGTPFSYRFENINGQVRSLE